MHDNSVLTLLHKQLTDQLEAPEKRLLIDWLENSSKNVEEQQDVSQIWELSGNYTPPFEPDVDKSFEKFQQKLKADAVSPPAKIVALNPIKSWMKIAAVGAVLFGCLAVWQLTQNANVNHLMVSTITDEVKELDLADGSKVWINEKSSFSYPDKFNRGERVVTLDGQAFFDVESDAAKPFIIKGGEADIKVLGTSFSFNTSNNEGLMEVEVKEGTVQVTPVGSGEGQVVTKNEKLFYDADKKMFLPKELLSVSNADFFVSKTYRFENSKYTYVFDVLEWVYDVDFKLGEGLENCTFTSTIPFDKEDIQSTISIIEKAYEHRNLEVSKVSDNQYVIEAIPCE